MTLDILKEENKDSQEVEVKDPIVETKEDGSFTINGKHFKDVNALVHSKTEADRHIDTILKEKRKLEQRLQQLESSSTNVDSLSEKIDQLLQNKRPSSQYFETEEEQEGASMTNSENRQTTQAIDYSKAIEEAVSKAVKPLQDQFSTMQKQAVENKFSDAIIQRYGDEGKARETMEQFQKETGFSRDQIVTMIQTNPDNMVKLVEKIVPKPKNQTTTVYDPTSNYSHNRGGDVDTKPSKSFGDMVTKLRNAAKGANGETWSPEDQELLNAAHAHERGGR